MDTPENDLKESQEQHHEHEEKDNGLNLGDVRTFLTWSAPGRPYSKKGRQFYLTVMLLAVLFGIILFLISEYTLIVVVFALAFVSIALSYVPPHNFHYKISTEGIKVQDYFYLWQELYDFYFKKIEGQDILIVRTQAFLPGELKISLGEVTRDHVRQVLVNFLPYREYVKPTFMEKSADWLSHNFPLENVNK